MSGDRDRSLLFARILGGIGRTMITAGVLILLFVAYQLWGTGIRTSQAQSRLDDELAAILEQADGAVVGGATGTSTTTTASSPTTSTTTTVEEAVTTTSRLPATTAPALAPELLPAAGEAAGQLVIPAISVDWTFVEGVSVNNLKDGPGHYPETPLPGQAGNSAIAGHRTTYGAPFGNVDQLAAGDEITVTTIQGRFTYVVRETRIVSPSQTEVLGADAWDFDGDPTTPHNALTLTACHPKYSASQRIVIAAELVGEPAAATPRADVAEEPVEFESNLSGNRSGAWPAILWALICAAIWLVAWAVGKRRRPLKWPAYFVGLGPFAVALFFFFENFSRLLPANY